MSWDFYPPVGRADEPALSARESQLVLERLKTERLLLNANNAIVQIAQERIDARRQCDEAERRVTELQGTIVGLRRCNDTQRKNIELQLVVQRESNAEIEALRRRLAAVRTAVDPACQP